MEEQPKITLTDQMIKPVQQAIAATLKKLMGPMLSSVETRVKEVFQAQIETLRSVQPVPVTSEQTNEIFGALGKWQIQRQQVDKNAEVKTPKYSFWYADLSQIIFKTTSGENGLGNFGLSITHILAGTRVYCRLMHESGEWIQSYLDLEKADKMQDFAGDITYAKRYTLASLLGIAAEDDTDGNAREAVKLVKKEPQATGKKLQVLTPGNETWNKLTKGLAAKQITLEQITAKYSMRDDVRARLENIRDNSQ